MSLHWQVYQNTEVGTIMQTKLPPSIAADWPHLIVLNELFVDDWRAVRAKYPNGDPFTTSRVTEPTGYVDGAASWIAPDRSMEPAVEIHVSQPVPDYTVYFPQFQLGLEGTVRHFDPPHSFWALRNPPGGGGSTYVIPQGFRWNDAFSPRAANWSNSTTGRIFTFHGSGWGSWHFAIAAVYLLMLCAETAVSRGGGGT